MINRKNGGLRTWMLGAAATGLLLPSYTALAQTRRVPEKSKKAIAFNKKKSNSKTVAVPSSEPPQLLKVPETIAPQTTIPASNVPALTAPALLAPPLSVPIPTPPPAYNIQPISQTEAAAEPKSEVQRQLEALYEQDGREMPSMKMNLQPISPPPGKTQQSAMPAPVVGANQAKPTTAPKPTRPGQGYTQYQPKSAATAYPGQAPVYSPSALPQAQSSAQAPRNYRSAIDAQNPAMMPSQVQTQHHPQAPISAQPQAKPNAVASFFKKLTASNKPLTTQAPTPPDFANGAPANPVVSPVLSAAPASAANPTATASSPTTMKYYSPPNSTASATQPVTSPALLQAESMSIPKQPPTNAQFVVGVSSIPSLTQPTLAIPAFSSEPLALQAASLPPLLTEAQPQVRLVKSVPRQERPVANASDVAATFDFPNPFPEDPESQADARIMKPGKSAEVALQEDVPKTVVVTETKPEPALDHENVVRADEDPFAVTAKDFSEPMINEKIESNAARTQPVVTESPAALVAPEQFLPPEIVTNPTSESPSSVWKSTDRDAPSALAAQQTDDAKPAVEPTPSVASPSVDAPLTPPAATAEAQLEKMKRIRERFGMKGLKGFCPVTLHDARDLVDAKPEFHIVHRSQKFHFASAEARNKFEADPARYAPAAYGADVVALSRDKDIVEGVLDYAAWFKGRLYLFGTQANYDAFIAAPAKFATLAGVE